MMMAISKMTLFARTLVLMGAFTSRVAANAPLSDKIVTKTATPQEVGSMTSDGFLVHSMNWCTIKQTTNCQVYLSTGALVPETTSSGSTDVAVGTSTVPPGSYPAPTYDNGGATTAGEPAGYPTGGGATSHNQGDATSIPPGGETDGSASGISSGSETTPAPGTGSHSSSKTSGHPTATDTKGDRSGTPTGSAPSDSATAGGAVVHAAHAGLFGAVGIAAAFVV